jgi:quercetin dioxygenase-like cupin family protein
MSAIEIPVSEFVDERGSIVNLVSQRIGNVALISSKRGAIRSNHFHKKDWHYLYVLSGRMLYFERGVGEKDFPPGELISKGQMVFTEVNREHAVLFLDDSEILSLARNPQMHDAHEADVVRVPFLSRQYADNLLKEYP